MIRSLKQPTLLLPLLALLAGVLVLLPMALKVHVLEYDEAIFMDVARSIQRTGLPLRTIGDSGAFFFDHTPLYVYLLSLYANASDAGILAARLVTAIFGLGCVWLTYQIGARLRNPASGFVAALLLAINSFFALQAFQIHMEIPLLAALLVSLWLLPVGKAAPQRSHFLAAGMALAAALLLKEVAILFAGWCAVYAWLICRRSRRPTLPALAALLLPPILGLALWGGWAWKLSPSTFTSTMNRWVSSMAAVNLLDPRARLGAVDWAQQLTFDLLGPALVIGLATSLLIQIARWGLQWQTGKRLDPAQVLLWGYVLSAIGISFAVRLKEPRHLIGILPVTGLLIGTSIDWRALINRVWVAGGRGRKAVFGLAVILFVLIASPLRLPSGPITHVDAWLDPLYGWRILENDRFYNVLRLTGRYIQAHTDPADVITVAHQATVTAYYADRRYVMLYTQRPDAIARTLARTSYLVWDDEDFQALTRNEVEALRGDIQQRFTLQTVIRDGDRTVMVYR